MRLVDRSGGTWVPWTSTNLQVVANIGTSGWRADTSGHGCAVSIVGHRLVTFPQQPPPGDGLMG